MDYNVNNYTITELLSILELDDPNKEQITNASDNYISRYTAENNPEMVIFFQKTQTKLLQYISALKSGNTDDDSEQTEQWIKYESLPQQDAIQSNKVTDRIQKIKIYDNQHVPMKKEQLGISNTHEAPVAQGVLNPTLKNTTQRFINLDSQFRQESASEDSSTNYTLDLSDTLTNVLNLRLYSIQIPFAWYVIDSAYGNTCFWITNSGTTFKISAEPGNYTPDTFCTMLQESFVNAGFTYNNATVPMITTYNSNNGKITLKLHDWKDPNENTINISSCDDIYTSSENKDSEYAYYTFFDITGTNTCYSGGDSKCGHGVKGQTNSGTLGWLMGFRVNVEFICTNGNTPESLINLYGTKYFIVVLDDYNQNHVNNGLVTITELSKSLPVPDYYNTSQPYICQPNGYGGDIPTVLPSAPRTLTSAQLYTINEIMKNREKTTTFRAKAPSTTDTFALIPIKGVSSTGDVYVDFSGGLQDNTRVYFGPVTINRLHIKLLDDRGNVVDLHGADWTITLISENLYQY